MSFTAIVNPPPFLLQALIMGNTCAAASMVRHAKDGNIEGMARIQAERDLVRSIGILDRGSVPVGVCVGFEIALLMIPPLRSH